MLVRNFILFQLREVFQVHIRKENENEMWYISENFEIEWLYDRISF